jgi:hypothetical protein
MSTPADYRLIRGFFYAHLRGDTIWLAAQEKDKEKRQVAIPPGGRLQHGVPFQKESG